MTALFGKKKNEEKKEETAPTVPLAPKEKTVLRDPSEGTIFSVLKDPRITEKGTELGEHGVYVFNVRRDATKQEIGKAVEALYSVAPRKIRTLRVLPKKVFGRGRGGTRPEGKKAYVYLKEGDSIEVL